MMFMFQVLKFLLFSLASIAIKQLSRSKDAFSFKKQGDIFERLLLKERIIFQTHCLVFLT